MSRAAVMGVINATPDSFFVPSRVEAASEAIERGRQMAVAGASIVDVGGESTRPGAEHVREADELARVVPVIEGLAGAVRLSIDTVKPEVARRAVEAGATLVNDVSGALAPLAAAMGAGWVSMHHRGIPAAGHDSPVGPAIFELVRASVLDGARAARELGVDEVYVDPGIGFGKDAADNLRLVAHLDELCDAAHAEGFGVLFGASRKRFLGALPHGGDLGVDERMEGSVAVAVFAMACGVDVVRVHDVVATAQAAALIADEEVAA